MSGWFYKNDKRIDILASENDIDNYLETIKYNLLKNEQTIKALREENSEIKAETYRDEELQRMKEELDGIRSEMRLGFPMSQEERNEVYEWQKSHDAEEHNNPKSYHGAIGGGYTYEFSPTSIGTFGSCICGACRWKAMIAGATADTPAAKKNGFDKGVYNQYMEDHNGVFDFQEA